MSGLVQPAGDASIDLGSDLTPGPLHPPSSSSANPETTSFGCSGLLVAKLPLPGGRRDRERKRQRESAGRQGVDVRDGGEVDTRRAKGRLRKRVEDLEVRLARATPSTTHVHSHLLHLRPPPLTLDTLQWCSSLRLNLSGDQPSPGRPRESRLNVCVIVSLKMFNSQRFNS